MYYRRCCSCNEEDPGEANITILSRDIFRAHSHISVLSGMYHWQCCCCGASNGGASHYCWRCEHGECEFCPPSQPIYSWRLVFEHLGSIHQQSYSPSGLGISANKSSIITKPSQFSKYNDIRYLKFVILNASHTPLRLFYHYHSINNKLDFFHQNPHPLEHNLHYPRIFQYLWSKYGRALVTAGSVPKHLALFPVPLLDLENRPKLSRTAIISAGVQPLEVQPLTCHTPESSERQFPRATLLDPSRHPSLQHPTRLSFPIVANPFIQQSCTYGSAACAASSTSPTSTIAPSAPMRSANSASRSPDRLRIQTTKFPNPLVASEGSSPFWNDMISMPEPPRPRQLRSNSERDSQPKMQKESRQKSRQTSQQTRQRKSKWNSQQTRSSTKRRRTHKRPTIPISLTITPPTAPNPQFPRTRRDVV